MELEDDIEEHRKLARCLVSDRRSAGGKVDVDCASRGYELILGAIVLASIVIMAVEFQFTGYVLGQELGFKDMSELPRGEENPVWVIVTILGLDTRLPRCLRRFSGYLLLPRGGVSSRGPQWASKALKVFV